MKIRNGFVSNSSSSSFFFMGVKLNDVKQFDPKLHYHVIDCECEYENGPVVINIDKPLIKAINANPEYIKYLNKCDIYEVLVDDADILTDEMISKLANAREQGKIIYIKSGTCDQNAPYDVNSFEEHMDYIKESNENT